MITLPFDPNVHLGPVQLAWHGIFTAVGIFFGVALPVRLLRGRVSEDALYAVATPAVIGGIIGARLFHVIDCWSLCGYDTNPLLIPQIWTGGIAIMGAVIVGALTGYVIAVRRGDIPIGGTADAAAAGIGIGMAIGRIGDIINGEHRAAHANLPWSVIYVNPQTLGERGIPVHPEVAYELIMLVAIVVVQVWLWSRIDARRVPAGVEFAVGLLAYAIGRFFLSYLRLDPTYLFGLRGAQILGIIACGHRPWHPHPRVCGRASGQRATGPDAGTAPLMQVCRSSSHDRRLVYVSDVRLHGCPSRDGRGQHHLRRSQGGSR